MAFAELDARSIRLLLFSTPSTEHSHAHFTEACGNCCRTDSSELAQGTYLSSGGPVGQGFGGATTAAPLDGISATYWNPASISDVQKQLGFGLGLVLPEMQTSSSAFGASGTSRAEPGVSAIPTISWVHREEGSRTTYAVGIHGVAGYRTNYAASTTNPLFTPQPNTVGTPGGFGSVHTEAQFLQIAPMISYAITENLSIGGGPTITLGDVTVDPFVFAAPDDADGTLQPRYPGGTGSRMHWGGGAQFGLYYVSDNHIHLGFSLKSTQRMEDLRYNSADELGLPRTVRTKMELPMILSWGAAYSGIEDLMIAVDLRYLDFENTDFWGGSGFNPDGSLIGLGMESVVSVSTGVQYDVSDDLTVRCGYMFTENPFPPAATMIAAAAPLFYQHQVSFGLTRKLSDSGSVHMAYTYYPTNAMTGPIVTAAGAIPGSSVSTRAFVHMLNIGATIKY